MTPTRLHEIRQRAEKATEGPWQVIETSDDDARMVIERRIATEWHHPQLHGPSPVVNSFVTILPVRGQKPYHGVRIDAPDADFIAHAREDIPALLAAWDTQQTALRALVEQWKNEAEYADIEQGEPEVASAVRMCAADLERILTPEQS